MTGKQGQDRRPRYEIERVRNRLRAVCQCGWSSPRVISAGGAGAQWDRHIEEAGCDGREALGA